MPLSEIKSCVGGTVKPVYNDHLGDKVSVVVLDRWSLKEDLCIMAKTVSSDFRSLYKGSIIFHLITHDTDKKLCCDKTTYYK